MLSAERKSAIDEHGPEFLLFNAGFKNQKGSELSIAILLDDVAILMFGDKRFHGFIEREPADSHKVGDNSLLRQQFKRLAYCQVAATHCDHSELRAGVTLNDRGWNELRGRLVFLEQPVHYFLVLVRDFRVPAELVVPGTANEIRALGINARQSSRCDEVFILVCVALELRQLVDFLGC